MSLIVDLFDCIIGPDGEEDAAVVARVPVVDPKAAIVKPSQMQTPKYINGVPYYDTLVQYTDEGGQGGTGKKRTRSGYMKKSDFDALNVSTVSIPANFAGLEAEMVPTRLMPQLFRIVEVVENEDYVEVTARHVWYDNLKNYTVWEPTKDTDYSAGAVCRNILTNAISPTASDVATDCTATKKGSEFDYKNKNLVEAFLDPEKGVCAQFGLSLIRYDWDFYCLKEVGFDRGFVIENGKNLLGVERTESIENVATRVAAYGKDAKGNVIWLNNDGLKYVDSQYIENYSAPMVELYDTGITIGKNGVTAANVQDKLLEAAQNRFDVDHVDIPEVEMTISFVSLGDTEEYVQYRGLDKVYLYDILHIKDTVRGYEYSAQVVGVEHDILTGMLLSVTIGKLDNWDGTRKIATWQVPEVDGTNIRLLSIQAGSFAPGSIGSADLQDAIIQYAHFASATIDTLNSTTITAVTAHIQEIIAGKITADSIDTTDINAINATLGTATIENGMINNADISFAKIKALTSESLIARDAVTDKYFIDKLQVRNAQFVQATVGELVIKASNNKYYRLDIDANGAMSPTEVTLSAGEISAGVTEDGHGTIIETDLTVADLSASNMKGINALIDKLTAARIDVDELFARQAYIGKLETSIITSAGAMGVTAAGIEIKSSKYFKIKSGGTFTVDSGNFSIDASGNVTLTGTITAGAGSEIGGWVLGANRIYSGTGTGYVAMDSDTSGTYAIWAGNGTASSAPFSVTRAGAVKADSGTIGGWSISSSHIGNASTLNASTAGITNAANSSDLVFWAGGAYNGTGANAPKFRVAKDGTVTLTALRTVGEGGVETDVNLRTAGLWKLSSINLKDASYDSGTQTLTITRFSGGDVVVNFSGAGSVVLEGGWVGNTYTVTETTSGTASSILFSCKRDTGTTSGAYQNYNLNSFDSSHKAYVEFTSNDRENALYSVNIDASSEYNAGRPASATLGSKVTGTTYNLNVTQENGVVKGLTINLNAAYTDARAGYTLGTFTLASVTLQGASQQVYIAASSGGYTYYQAQSPVTYYKGDGARYSSATRYPAGTKATYYRGNGSRLSAATRYKAGTAATYYRGNGARYASATRYTKGSQVTPTAGSFRPTTSGTLYYAGGQSAGTGNWFRVSTSYNYLYSAGSAVYAIGDEETVLVPNSSGTYYLRGDSVSVTAQGSAESVYVYDASGSYYLRGDSVEVTPIGTAQTVLVSNNSGAYYLRGTSESVTKIDTSKKIEHLTQTTRYAAGSTVTNQYYTKS